MSRRAFILLLNAEKSREQRTRSQITFETSAVVTSCTATVTDVPYTGQVTSRNIRIVVWQFWGRAAEAS
jgi:hypothetical protein